MRTNIEIDDDLVRVVMDRYGLDTMTEAVDLALHHLAGQPMTRDEALAMRGTLAIDDLPTDDLPTDDQPTHAQPPGNGGFRSLTDAGPPDAGARRP